MKHVMLDIETWGVKPFSTIISIGAVYFDPKLNNPIKDGFHVAIDPEAAQRNGFRVDASTLLFWMKMANRDALEKWRTMDKLDPQTAFFSFGQWLHGLFDLTKDPTAHDGLGIPDGQTFDPADFICMWGNGAAFDNVLLRSGYELLQLEPPWKHWNDRCFRTMKNLRAPNVDPKRIMPPREGIVHDALSDAVHQAQWLCNIVQALNIKL